MPQSLMASTAASVNGSFWASGAWEELEEYGVAPSSVFASTSRRSMPWEKPGTKQETVGPGAYDTSGDRSMASQCCKHSARSAAFASSADRFPRARPAQGEVYQRGSAISHLHDASRPSAAFASGSRRLKSSPWQSPGPQYYPQPARELGNASNSARSGPSSGLASTMERRLPFEAGGERHAEEPQHCTRLSLTHAHLACARAQVGVVPTSRLRRPRVTRPCLLRSTAVAA